MTGNDLFRAMNGVDETLIDEAETYTGHKVIPMRMVRWVSAAAACFCLLVCAAVIIRSDMFSMKSAECVVMEEKAEAMIEKEETVITEETVEEEIMTETTEEGGFATGSTLEDTSAVEVPKNTEGVVIYDHYTGDDKAIYCYAGAAGGEWFCEEYLRQMVEMYGSDENARFLIAFYLWKDGEMLEPDSPEYRAETDRLKELGYEFRLLDVPHTDKSLKYLVCGLFTAEQLTDFAAAEEYGYIFYFPEDEYGQPLSWEEQVLLCGLPTDENE